MNPGGPRVFVRIFPARCGIMRLDLNMKRMAWASLPVILPSRKSRSRAQSVVRKCLFAAFTVMDMLEWR
jgi:hypothetical protein